MIAVVTVYDETASGEQTHRLKVKLVSERVTVAELIQRRVQQEAERFNLERPVSYRSLVQPAEAQEVADGYRLLEHRDVDWQKQLEPALDAFRKNNLSVMIDGRLASDLEQEVVITDSTVVTFVKLMPITGG